MKYSTLGTTGINFSINPKTASKNFNTRDTKHSLNNDALQI